MDRNNRQDLERAIGIGIDQELSPVAVKLFETAEERLHKMGNRSQMTFGEIAIMSVLLTPEALVAPKKKPDEGEE